MPEWDPIWNKMHFLPSTDFLSKMSIKPVIEGCLLWWFQNKHGIINLCAKNSETEVYNDCSPYTNTYRYTYSYTKFSKKGRLVSHHAVPHLQERNPIRKTRWPRYMTFPAGDLPPFKGTYLLSVVLGIGRNTLMKIPLLRIYCLATAPCFISIFRRFHLCLVCQYGGFGRLANKAEERETGQQTFRNAGREKLFAWVAELVKHQHEEDSHAVTYQELQDQQRGADIQVDIGFINVPHQQEECVLNESQYVIHSQSVPVLGFVN